MAVDVAWRREAMARSQKLGHCVCNLRQPCPCPEFIERNVCHCAGERSEPKAGQVALTRLTRRAGCASKIGQGDLLKIVRNLPATTDPNVLVGAGAGDDAGVYRLDQRRALVQTVDVFTPCVDDPYLFGQIAAANSLSDIYAMGGRPLTALSIIGFPIEELDGAIMEAILQGGIAKLEEARCRLLGGHSINDSEIKCGFAVTGLIDPAAVMVRDCAQPGDALVLTKPLGTGVISFAASLGRCPEQAIDEAGAAMATLNRDAAELMTRFEAHACTDVTGFGLAGHLIAMAQGSRVDVEIDLSATPVFAVAADCIKGDLYPGALDRNQVFATPWIRAIGNDGRAALPILFDPQTSGGLLVSLPEARVHDYVEALRDRGHAAASIIGRVVEMEGTEPRITVTNVKLTQLMGTREPLIMPSAKLEANTNDVGRNTRASAEDCCVSPPIIEPNTQSSSDGALDTFKEFLREANKPGLIDARAKKLMAIALSVAQRCRPCALIHIRAARKLGIPRAEIDEAAGLAIAFGGCTALMFYTEIWDELGKS